MFIDQYKDIIKFFSYEIVLVNYVNYVCCVYVYVCVVGKYIQLELVGSSFHECGKISLKNIHKQKKKKNTVTKNVFHFILFLQGLLRNAAISYRFSCTAYGTYHAKFLVGIFGSLTNYLHA